jgi:putative sterol carrier protein
MTDATTEFFDSLRARGHEPLLAKGKGSLRFDIIDGQQTEHWFVTIDKGDVGVAQEGSNPTCRVQSSKHLFDRVIRGDTNAMAATIRGEVTVEGDAALLLMFSRLLPGPSKSSHPRSRIDDLGGGR